jgi:hypothetical protein
MIDHGNCQLKMSLISILFASWRDGSCTAEPVEFRFRFQFQFRQLPLLENPFYTSGLSRQGQDGRQHMTPNFLVSPRATIPL